LWQRAGRVVRSKLSRQHLGQLTAIADTIFLVALLQRSMICGDTIRHSKQKVR
jgi:hypothetical protein